MANSAGGHTSNFDENGSDISHFEPDSNEMFKTETANIVRQFVYDRFEEENEVSNLSHQDEIPVVATARPDALEELRSVRQENDPDSMAVRVSRRLRNIGDEIQNKYHDDFQIMINQLNLTNPASAYEGFAEVAGRLFKNGITWPRIVALLCFGYEITKHVLRNGLAGSYMRKLFHSIVDFIVNGGIANWIDHNGGWHGFLENFQLNEPSWSTVATVLVSGILCVLWVLHTDRK